MIKCVVLVHIQAKLNQEDGGDKTDDKDEHAIYQ